MSTQRWLAVAAFASTQTFGAINKTTSIAGNGVVRVSGSLTLAASARIQADGGAGQVLFVVNGNIDLGGGARTQGTYISKFGNTGIGTALGSYMGAFIVAGAGKTLALHSTATIDFIRLKPPQGNSCPISDDIDPTTGVPMASKKFRTLFPARYALEFGVQIPLPPHLSGLHSRRREFRAREV
jgi:hypothetical protein